MGLTENNAGPLGQLIGPHWSRALGLNANTLGHKVDQEVGPNRRPTLRLQCGLRAWDKMLDLLENQNVGPLSHFKCPCLALGPNNGPRLSPVTWRRVDLDTGPPCANILGEVKSQ